MVSADNTEAQVKRWVKDVLKEYNVYYFMPVQSGYGAAGVDFHCVVDWCSIPLGFFIETKEFGKEPTARQNYFIEQRRHHQKAKTFVIDGVVGTNQLRAWLEKLKQQSEALANKREKRVTDGHT